MNDCKIDQSTSSHGQDFVANENTIQNSEKLIVLEIAQSMPWYNFKIDASTPSHRQDFVATENTLNDSKEFVDFGTYTITS